MLRVSVRKTKESILGRVAKLPEKPDLLQVCKEALADLEGIMPEFDPDGERTHPAWETIERLKSQINQTEKTRKE